MLSADFEKLVTKHTDEEGFEEAIGLLVELLDRNRKRDHEGIGFGDLIEVEPAIIGYEVETA